MTPCLTCGRPCRGPRCPAHQRQHKAKYGVDHQALRARWDPIVASGTVTCSLFGIDPQCPGLIEAGAAWDLGHVPPPSRPQHAPCNRRLH